MAVPAEVKDIDHTVDALCGAFDACTPDFRAALAVRLADPKYKAFTYIRRQVTPEEAAAAFTELGGAIAVESRDGAVTTFTLTLPARFETGAGEDAGPAGDPCRFRVDPGRVRWRMF